MGGCVMVVASFSGCVIISILVAVPQFAGRNITDDKRNLKVAATSKKEGLRHSHFSLRKISR